MAEIKVSSLSQAVNVNALDQLMVLNGDNFGANQTNKRLTLQTLFQSIKCPMTFNPTNLDADAIFKGTSNSNLLVVDASANNVGIGTPAPASLLHVGGDIRIGVDGGNGNLIFSKEVVTIPDSNSISLVISSATMYTSIKTLDTSATSHANIALNSPGGNQIKVISYDDADPSKPGGVSYTVNGSFTSGATSVKFVQQGDTAVLFGALNKWTIISISGGTVVN
jgi:hypothetical protein